MSPAAAAVVCLVLFTDAVAAHEPPASYPDAYAALGMEGLEVWKQIVDAGGMAEFFKMPRMVATVFAPNNTAVAELLADMGLGLPALLADYWACRKLAMYHVLPRRLVRTADWHVSDKSLRFFPSLFMRKLVGIELDEKKCWRPNDHTACVYDVDGTDDDAELSRDRRLVDVPVGAGLLHVLDDVITYRGYKRRYGARGHYLRNDVQPNGPS